MKKSLIGSLLASVAGFFTPGQTPVLPMAARGGTRSKYHARSGRNVLSHRMNKDDFNVDIRIQLGDDPYTMPTKHIKVARKAAIGTLTVPGGRRGLMTKYNGYRWVVAR